MSHWLFRPPWPSKDDWWAALGIVMVIATIIWAFTVFDVRG